ncbi:hypothetical protein AKJ16_DCAP18784, partial [Drosera capensis]
MGDIVQGENALNLVERNSPYTLYTHLTVQVSPELHGNVAYLESARDQWCDLEERFTQGNALYIQELKPELTSKLTAREHDFPWPEAMTNEIRAFGTYWDLVIGSASPRKEAGCQSLGLASSSVRRGSWDLDEEVYMKPPPSYLSPGDKHIILSSQFLQVTVLRQYSF